jgi:hypothetical protein
MTGDPAPRSAAVRASSSVLPTEAPADDKAADEADADRDQIEGELADLRASQDLRDRVDPDTLSALAPAGVV